ncbi:lysozyme [Clostridium acetobutylicum]|uniref:GH25 family lysozyme n=1 Tax=Clostridium TaxID=1485 RepID=UPI0017A3B4BC|nr:MULTISPECIES: GH25 family lysozyme [Clostridium]NSA93968.1 lysozyme [Clostridium acetobutylicum]NYC95102.1 lysozyme [Clostridium acetobutylicum]
MTLLTAVLVISAVIFMPLNIHAQIYKGVDVYEYDNISNYQQLKSNGVSVVIQKATEGLCHNDSLLNYRYNAIIQNGFKVGYYHFADNTGQPVAEAQHFLSKVQGLHSDTILWLDIENESNWTKWQAIDYTNKFIGYVQSQGYRIGLYSGLSFYYEYLKGNITNVPLWLASYGRQPAQFPNIVSWQYSENERINGVVGDIDLDYFNDSIFTGQAPRMVQSNMQVQTYNRIKTIQAQLNAVLYSSKLVVDGIQGNATTQQIRVFQQVCGLKTDGIWGQQCVNAIQQIYGKDLCGRPYIHRIPTRIIQYNMGIQFDGIYGRDTASHVQAWQSSHSLKSDGLFGSQSWLTLLSK